MILTALPEAMAYVSSQVIFIKVINFTIKWPGDQSYHMESHPLKLLSLCWFLLLCLSFSLPQLWKHTGWKAALQNSLLTSSGLTNSFYFKDGKRFHLGSSHRSTSTCKKSSELQPQVKKYAHLGAFGLSLTQFCHLRYFSRFGWFKRQVCHVSANLIKLCWSNTSTLLHSNG